MRRYTAALLATVFSAAPLATAPLAAQNAPQSPAKLPATTIVGGTGRTVTVQNDRAAAVTFFVENGRVEHAVGTVPANSTGTIELPTWATRRARTLTLLARAEGDAARVAQYELPLRDKNLLGLLVPPAGGLPAADSLLVATPAGAAATVTVDNARAQRVTVYAEQGLLFVMLGQVEAKSQGTLAVPTALLKNGTPLRVFARPEGEAQVSTNALRLKQGDHIAVVIM